MNSIYFHDKHGRLRILAGKNPFDIKTLEEQKELKEAIKEQFDIDVKGAILCLVDNVEQKKSVA